MFTIGGARLKVKADEINTKAQTLQSTATPQSTVELASTQQTDINSTTNTLGNKLKEKAEELGEKAQELNQAADDLEQAARPTQGPQNPLATLEGLAEKLRDAAKQEDGEDRTSLHYHAEHLASHTDGEAGLEGKAGDVIQKFGEVKGAYEALSSQPAYTAHKTHHLVTVVESEYKALETIYDGMLNLTKLIVKATALSSTVQGPSTSTELQSTLIGPAQILATKAQELSEAANRLSGDSELQSQATALATAAGTSTGLAKNATELQSAPTDYSKATAVIEAFDKVKQDYEALITLAIENNKLDEVQDVISKFKDLKNHYDTMMPFSKIKYYSEQIETQAEQLRTDSGGDADTVVRYFESMEVAYSNLTEKSSVQSQFEPLKSVYDKILNVTKMKHYSNEVESKAPLIANSGVTPSEVKTLIDIIKKAYDGADAEDQNIVKNDWDNLKNVISGEMKYWKFGWIVAPSIISQWLNFLTYKLALNTVTDDKLKTATGTDSSQGLRELALALHQKASALNTAVTSVSNQDAAKVLKYKAGTDDTTDGNLRKLAADLHNAAQALERDAPGNSASDDQALKLKAGKNENDGLRKLAKELYESAQALADKVTGSPGDSGAAKELADAVGETEDKGIRKELKALAQASDLKAAADAVKEAYDKGGSGGEGVKQKYQAVKGQNETYKSYTGKDKEALYKAVEAAWKTFEALYETDLKGLATELKAAVGEEAESNKLQKTLVDLGNHKDSQGAPTTLATKVKTAYQGNTGVRPKFEPLQKF